MAVSIKTALEEAEKGHLGSYLAITDSILGVIKCCPMLLATDKATDKASLKNVCLYEYINYNNTVCMHDHVLQAKDILKRIEARDLYHCSWKVRIPKISHPSIPGASQKVDDGGNLWRALMAIRKQPEGESINAFLTPEKQKTIKEKHLWVPVSACNNLLCVAYLCAQLNYHIIIIMHACVHTD